jgi:hypothetical protein
MMNLSYFSETKVLVDGGAHSEHGKVIRCDIKPRSAEKCIFD